MLTAQKIIIRATRKIAPVSERPKVPVSGQINAISSTNVSATDKWAINLFPNFTPLTKESNKIPANTGIRAVGDGVTDPR